MYVFGTFLRHLGLRGLRGTMIAVAQLLADWLQKMCLLCGKK